MPIDLVRLYLGLDGRGSEGENLWTLGDTWSILRIVEVCHDQVVEMLLVSMMGLIQYKHVQVLHLDVPVHQKVVELPSNENENVIVTELLDPVLVLVHPLVVFAS